MFIESHYSRSFYSDALTSSKFEKVLAYAEHLRNIRNELSLLINKNTIHYMGFSKIDFQKEALPLIKDRVSSNFTKQQCDDVLKAYQNRFEAIISRLKFSSITIELSYYKRNQKDKKKGDFRKIIYKRKQTDITEALSFLARYGNDNTVNYLSNSIFSEKVKQDTKIFYAKILNYIERYGYERLLKLALLKRKNTLNRYKEPIKFESLSFRGRSRLITDIVSYNENFKSIIKAFINISWLGRGTILKIPVKYSKEFHGEMKRYTNGTDTSYTICISSSDKSLRIILSYEEKREYPVGNKKTDKYVGFDANIKHNQLVGSNGLVTYHDKKSLFALIEELLKIDKSKEKNRDYKVGKKKQKKIDTLRRKIEHHTERNCVFICKQMNTNGENHAVFENLTNGFGKCYQKQKRI